MEGVVTETEEIKSSLPVSQRVWLTAAQAVDYLGLKNLKALRNKIRRYGLPYHRLGGELRFLRSELDKWLTKN